MTEQEYVRKYMLKDIVKRNLRFWWLIVIFAAAFAAGLGYKKYSESQDRFAKTALRGTVSQYTIDYYSGNVTGETLLIRSQSLIKVLTSKETYYELVSLGGYTTMQYDAFEEFVQCDNDGTKDSVTVKLEYPFGSDGFEVLDDEAAIRFMNYYRQAAANTCTRILGADVVYELGVGEPYTYTYEATDEQRSAAFKAIVKNVFIGGVIGFIIPVVIITIVYLFGGKLRTAEEIAFCAGYRLIAKVSDADTAELSRAQLYLEHKYGTEGMNINLIHVGGGGEYIADALRQSFTAAGYKGSISVTDTIADISSADAFRTALQCSANILVVGAGQVKEQDIEQTVRALSLYDIEGSGVIVYEPDR